MEPPLKKLKRRKTDEITEDEFLGFDSCSYMKEPAIRLKALGLKFNSCGFSASEESPMSIYMNDSNMKAVSDMEELVEKSDARKIQHKKFQLESDDDTDEESVFHGFDEMNCINEASVRLKAVISKYYSLKDMLNVTESGRHTMDDITTTISQSSSLPLNLDAKNTVGSNSVLPIHKKSKLFADTSKSMTKMEKFLSHVFYVKNFVRKHKLENDKGDDGVRVVKSVSNLNDYKAKRNADAGQTHSTDKFTATVLKSSEIILNSSKFGGEPVRMTKVLSKVRRDNTDGTYMYNCKPTFVSNNDSSKIYDTNGDNCTETSKCLSPMPLIMIKENDKDKVSDPVAYNQDPLYYKDPFADCETTSGATNVLTEGFVSGKKYGTKAMPFKSQRWFDDDDDDTESELSDTSVDTSDLCSSSDSEEEEEEDRPDVDVSKYLACDVVSGDINNTEGVAEEIPTYETLNYQLKCPPHVSLQLLRATDITWLFCSLNLISGHCGSAVRNLLSEMKHKPQSRYIHKIVKEKELEVPHFLMVKDPLVHSVFERIIIADRRGIPMKSFCHVIAEALKFLNPAKDQIAYFSLANKHIHTVVNINERPLNRTPHSSGLLLQPVTVLRQPLFIRTVPTQSPQLSLRQIRPIGQVLRDYRFGQPLTALPSSSSATAKPIYYTKVPNSIIFRPMVAINSALPSVLFTNPNQQPGGYTEPIQGSGTNIILPGLTRTTLQPNHNFLRVTVPPRAPPQYHQAVSQAPVVSNSCWSSVDSPVWRQCQPSLLPKPVLDLSNAVILKPYPGAQHPQLNISSLSSPVHLENSSNNISQGNSQIRLDLLKASDITNKFCYENRISGETGHVLRNLMKPKE